jgi:hypothetical protein
MNLSTVTKTSADFAVPPSAGDESTATRTVSVARLVEDVKVALGEMWLPHIYRARVLPLRTRAHHLDVPAKENVVQIQHTLLGVELKVGRRRMLCPDLATARYLAVFARAGCSDVAVPYDITKISRLADELESGWHRMLLLIERAAATRPSAYGSRARSLLVREAREEIKGAGAGTAIPQFNQNTKQRRAL